MTECISKPFVFAGVILALSLGQSEAIAQQSPNIIFILADDLGIGDIGVYNQNKRAELGLPHITTPNIDSLAINGMRFTNMHSCPMCSASRSTLHNGFHQGHGKVDRNVSKTNPIQPGAYEKTFAQLLQEKGYKTGIFGAWNLHGFNVQTGQIDDIHSSPFGKGYDRLWCNAVGSSYRTNYAVVDNDNENNVLENTDIQLVPRPFATDPNDQWAIENGGLGVAFEYGMKTTTEKAIQFLDEAINSNSNFLLTFTIFGVHANTNHVPNQGEYANLVGISEEDKNYAATVGQVDFAVGQLLEKLRDPNGNGQYDDSIVENTIIVFTSDNGNQSSSHDVETFGSTVYFDESANEFVDLRGEKFDSLDGGTKSPFIIQWAGNQAIRPGSTFDNMATFADWLPTVADMIKVVPPLGIDGFSFFEDLNGGTSVRPDLRVSMSAITHLGDWSIVVKDYKLFCNKEIGKYELYDLATNPEEIPSQQIMDRPDIANALIELALAEGVESDSAISADSNDYFCQYKEWQNNSEDFHSPTNWSGGTANLQYDSGLPALNHFTGPANNWIASLSHDSQDNQLVRVSKNSAVLAAELGASNAELILLVDSLRSLECRNELRVHAGGHIALDGSTLRNNRKISIDTGGKLTGSGTIVGDNELISHLPEFQGCELLRPRVINNGIVAPGRSNALFGIPSVESQPGKLLDSTGELTINGSFIQKKNGLVEIQLGGVNQNDNSSPSSDKLSIQNVGVLNGSLDVSIVDGWVPKEGDVVEIIRCNGGIEGEFNCIEFEFQLPGLSPAVIYTERSVLVEFSKN